MAQKREKEETELKVPTPILTPPKLSAPDEPTSTSARSLVTSDPLLDQTMRAGTGSEISDLDLNLNLNLDLLPSRSQHTAEEASDVKRREVNRCSGCRRKVGLTGFRCRCGDLFCSEHRYSDRHDCSFDYKAAGREAIARENPVVRPAKILKV